jgi:alginate O-acetyltransferase complex protein AlgI
MLFNSLIFLYFFLPACLLLVYIMPPKFRNTLLLIASLVFYAWGGVSYVFVMAGSIVLNYLAGLLIGYSDNEKTRKASLTAGIILNILLLVVFKYTGFITANLNVLTGLLGISPFIAGNILLPLGISFYTFKSITYLVSVKRRESVPERNMIDLGLYIAIFPQVIAGPIDRYNSLSAQIRHRSISFEKFSSGIGRFCLGLFKKVIISAPFAYAADQIFGTPAGMLSAPVAWLGAISFTLQIYYDFSGYTDMAIGLGRMFGFEFSENFNFPYISRSIREFWKRWHITLSSWLRDYIFLPLAFSFSRKLKKDRYLGIRSERIIYVYATLITFLVCGFWHGAAWNFVAWGLIQGILLSVEQTPFGKWQHKGFRPLAQLYVLVTFTLSLVVFRAPGLPAAGSYLGVMTGFGGEPVVWRKMLEFVDREYILMLILAVAGCSTVFRNILDGINKWVSAQTLAQGRLLRIGFAMLSVLGIFFLLAVATITMVSQTNMSFIYFKF